ncbi:MAG: methionine--tRNA ligase [Opitutaceae bacterium]
MNKRSYITTAIPYVNAAPHLGFALELVQADAIARRHRAAGRKVRLQTGTDENALKNVEAARAAGVETNSWVDARAAQFHQLADELDVGYDRFLRTTEIAHLRGVHQFWQALRPEDIIRKSYTGLYCSGCEDFLFPKDLLDGKCPDHRIAPVEVAESNYFFRLSSYQEALEDWISSGAVVIRPESRRNEILAFVRAGLQDISISRPSTRSGGWGIPVPGDHSQVVYVWIDALINYLSGLGYGTDETWREWWNEDTRKIHVIGKNVWKFHAVYWPALLLSAGLPLPDELSIHGFVTVDGRKISKSLGNAIGADDLIRSYGTDAVRYFLLGAVPQFGDSDFTAERFAATYQADLANGLGNLVSRLLTLAVRCGLESLPVVSEATLGSTISELEHPHDEALARIWSAIDTLNGELEAVKPWQAIRKGDALKVRGRIAAWLVSLAGITREIEPFLPATSQAVRACLTALPIRPVAPLFPRIVLPLSSH